MRDTYSERAGPAEKRQRMRNDRSTGTKPEISAHAYFNAVAMSGLAHAQCLQRVADEWKDACAPLEQKGEESGGAHAQHP